MSKKDELRNLQLIELEILKQVSKICDENNLKYYIIGGTLLGAKRHKGFIPWDDDIDIAMPRADYDKFIKIASKKLSLPLKINHYTIKGSDQTKYLASVVNEDVVVYEDRVTDFAQNVWIDILPIDALPNNKIKCFLFKFKTLYYRALVGFTNIDKIRNIKRPWYENILIKFARIIPVGKIINASKVRQKMDKMFKKQKYENANYIGTFLGRYGFHEVVPNEYFGNPTKIIFENIEFNAPQEIDKYLTHMYGDYMKLPPKHLQKQHIKKIEYKKRNELLDEKECI